MSDSPLSATATDDSEERTELVAALAHERNVLRTTIDLIPALIYANDSRSRFTACNELVARRMGTTPTALLGKTDFDFHPREQAERFFADEQALIASGKALIDQEEISFDATRHENRVILTSKVPLRDASGAITGFVGTGVDITDHKAAEECSAAREHLESIGRLAAGVAHEINTPIQFLSDNVTFIREGVDELLAHFSTDTDKTDNGEEIEYLRREMPPALESMADGLRRIAEIVRSMKQFSRADEREMGAVDINSAIQATLVIARSEYKHVAEVETDLQVLPPVTCHGGQINQVFLNLLLNAAHAIEEVVRGTGALGAIRVSTYTENDFAVISIADTGGGIPEEIRSRIFDPFFTTKQVGKGTGQGLSIAHNVIVKGHGGQIHFETELGIGTKFFVRLPLHSASGA